MSDNVFLNGEYLETGLPLRAVFYGEGLFETFRYRSRLPIFYGKHYERMRRGAEYLGIPVPEPGYIADLIRKAVSESGIPDAYIKICLLSGGNTVFFERPSESAVLISVKEYSAPEGPFAACISNVRRNSGSSVTRIKSLNYLENVIARREALGSGYDESIFVNEKGEVTEGAASNIFWVSDGALHTPSLECGLLPGITREILLGLAAGLGLDRSEGRYSPDDLYKSDLVVLTNSITGCGIISQVGDTALETDTGLHDKIKDHLFRELQWV